MSWMKKNPIIVHHAIRLTYCFQVTIFIRDDKHFVFFIQKVNSENLYSYKKMSSLYKGIEPILK